MKKKVFAQNVKLAKRTISSSKKSVVNATITKVDSVKTTCKKLYMLKKSMLAFMLFGFLQMFYLESSASVIPVRPYVGAALSRFVDGNTQNMQASTLSNYKAIAGLRFLSLLSAEVEYSKYDITANRASGKKNYNTYNYSAGLYLNPPLLRIFGNGLEAIIGAGMGKNYYEDRSSGVAKSMVYTKAVVGLRLIALDKFAVFTTCDFWLSKPEIAKNKYAPIVPSVGVNYLF